MDSTDAPQIVEHIHQSLPYTPFAISWIPNSASFVVLGETPRADGKLAIYSLEKGAINQITHRDVPGGFKCGKVFGPVRPESLGASTAASDSYQGEQSGSPRRQNDRKAAADQSNDAKQEQSHAIGSEDSQSNNIKTLPSSVPSQTDSSAGMSGPLLVTGQRDGTLSVWDIEHPTRDPLWSQRDAHRPVVNCVDLCSLHGPTEVVSGGRDGCVKVWDLRQKAEVLSLVPDDDDGGSSAGGGRVSDCWTVAFGNSHKTGERCVCSGYDNGDVKMFDLRSCTLKWERNVLNGVCHVQFDRRDILMNKLSVCTLEGKLWMFDLRTLHPEEGYAGVCKNLYKGTTWGCQFVPQNRDLFGVFGGSGQMHVCRYKYPEERKLQDKETGADRGVPGDVEILNDKTLSTQPIVSAQWHPQKLGLCAMAALDQALRVVIVTKLDKY
eukprot:GHVQ01028242.1.p1 GENE.GHVQ01028242.1~~GHVQ01028242.1.p1  ORF type:complete len:437 (-),score=60.22 GHVQ01028242.1:482-1792(-)